MQTAYVSPAPPAVDFLAIGGLLTEEERIVASTTQRFVGERVLPGIAEWFERGVFSVEMARELGRLGLLGMHLDEGTSEIHTLAVGHAITGIPAFRS